MTPRRSVIVLGAGVAGLTVAHELLERDFEVTLLEGRKQAGGKARSYNTTGSNPLPAEHGFRFFPGFYRNLDETMARIPLPDDLAATLGASAHKSVIDCLIPITDERLYVGGRAPITVPAAGRLNAGDVASVLRLPRELAQSGLTSDDLSTFANKLWQIATSCPERRNDEYEAIGWRDFVESTDRSDEYYWYLASGLTRGLVAARARYASTKTMGNVAMRLFQSATTVRGTTDRVLCGPTNAVFIEPWVAHLQKLGRERGSDREPRFKAIFEATVQRLTVADKRVRSVFWTVGTETVEAKVDYVVSALPVEALAELLRREPKLGVASAYTLDHVHELATDSGPKECLRLMRGLQIYLRKRLNLNLGHQLYLDSPWGLTSIAQREFWGKTWERFVPDKNVQDILSIDISSWDLRGLEKPPARDCTEKDVVDEVLAQLRAALGSDALHARDIVGHNLDVSRPLLHGSDSPSSLVVGRKGPKREVLEGLLVNRVGSWKLRPHLKEAGSRHGDENFFVAGDFVQTRTDLACMEGANEAARGAVNALLAACPLTGIRLCEIYGPLEPAVLAPLQALDRSRFERGLPWSAPGQVGGVLVRGVRLGGSAVDLVAPATPATMAAETFPHRPPRESWDSGYNKPIEVRGLNTEQVEKARRNRFAQPERADSMFSRWRLFEPLTHPHSLVPLHIYDANAVIIYGTASNVRTLRDLARDTGYHPVLGAKSRPWNTPDPVGFVEVWLVAYNDTSAGRGLEVAVNFPVNKNEHKKPVQWKSRYSSMVPMMDAENSLFTPLVLLQEGKEEDMPNAPGLIEYGRTMLGMNKVKAAIEFSRGPSFKFFVTQLEETVSPGDDRKKIGGPKSGEEPLVYGSVDLNPSRLETASATIELARAMGPVATAVNFQQAASGAELTSGLVTRNFSPSSAEIHGRPIVEIQTVYKFAPTICPTVDVTFGKGGAASHSRLGPLLQAMGFEAQVAAHVPHLKSIFYLDTWPRPDGV